MNGGISWREKWTNAYEDARFYQSERNAPDYWDSVAQLDGGGLSGGEHIRILKDHLLENGLAGEKSTFLDVGCGGGDYVVSFAKICRHITAVDYSEKMLELCKERCRMQGLDNVSYVCADFALYGFHEKYDIVTGCLNPALYRPDALDKMIALAEKTVIYFSMDSSLDTADNEPVYRGCNSVKYAEEYLKEQGIPFDKIPYVYDYRMENEEIRKIAFAYLVIRV